ncbi:hypothetical protein I4U23_008882 [Adineta vaga]|nr:hypothetical protein I4U23_008882 [Adineta vaga]
MFLRLIILLTIFGWFSIVDSVPVPSTYRKAELALNDYTAPSSLNPMVHSLLNVLIHVRQARAFISDDAIEMVLENVRTFDHEINGNNEQLLRQIIYHKNCKSDDKDCLSSNQNSVHTPSSDVKQRIILELDKFFETNKMDDYSDLIRKTKIHGK